MLERGVRREDVLRLRYEDLAVNPEYIGRQLCAFVGLDWEPQMLDLAQATRHLVNGNKTRFTPQKGIRLDDRWRKEMSAEDLAFFNRLGGELNRQLGYID